MPPQPETVQFFEGAVPWMLSREPADIPPPLLDHRLLPLLSRRQHLLLIAADLRHHFELGADQQPDLPPELVREQGQLAPSRRFLWRQESSPTSIGVPCHGGTLEGLIGHGGADLSTPTSSPPSRRADAS